MSPAAGERRRPGSSDAMKLKSMTGFGRGEAKLDGLLVEVEVSAVNRRQLDVRVALPRGAAVLESRLVEEVRKSVRRGAVSLSVRVAAPPGGQAVRVQGDVAAEYVRKLKQLGHRLGVDPSVSMGVLVTLPGVLTGESAADDPEKLWPAVRRAAGVALRELSAMRTREGSALGADMSRRLKRLGRIRARIAALAGNTALKSREALVERLERAKLAIPADDPSLMREVALLADRSDISEEVVRLASHMDQMAAALADGGAVGRTLDFVCQEMFREINTIGSKSGDIAVTRRVIEFKALLETVREQVQNLE